MKPNICTLCCTPVRDDLCDFHALLVAKGKAIATDPNFKQRKEHGLKLAEMDALMAFKKWSESLTKGNA